MLDDFEKEAMLPIGAARKGSGTEQFSASRRNLSVKRGSNASQDDGYRKKASLGVYLRRVIYYAQMDMGVASAEAYFLLTLQFVRLYRLAGWRSQTCGRWSKSDPAFACALSCLIGISTFAIGLGLGHSAISSLIVLAVLHVGIFLLSGVAIASSLWAVTNSGQFLVKHHFSSNVEVEWLYCFDIHTYAYFSLWVILYVVHYLLLPILLGDSFLSTLLSNSLFAIGFGVYTFVTFRGYLELPFLSKTQVTSLLYPVAAWLLVFLALTTINVNASKLAGYFLF